MDYRFLGRTGLRVSPLCLGTMNFGPETDEATSHQIMDEALDVGINFFDTANVYGARETEQIIGRWFALGGDRREKVVLATKVYGGRDPWPNSSRCRPCTSARRARTACGGCRPTTSTSTDAPHRPNDAVGRGVQAMDISWPRARCIVGSSNFAGRHLVQANETAKRRVARPRVGTEPVQPAGPYRGAGGAAAATAYGIGILPWSPLAGGLLGGALQKVTEGRRGAERVSKLVERHRDQLEAGGAVRRTR
jgi:aryl-alcohol dehydrogenase-like predicted oxidoreductase